MKAFLLAITYLFLSVPLSKGEQTVSANPEPSAPARPKNQFVSAESLSDTSSNSRNSTNPGLFTSGLFLKGKDFGGSVSNVRHCEGRPGCLTFTFAPGTPGPATYNMDFIADSEAMSFLMAFENALRSGRVTISMPDDKHAGPDWEEKSDPKATYKTTVLVGNKSPVELDSFPAHYLSETDKSRIKEFENQAMEKRRRERELRPKRERLNGPPRRSVDPSDNSWETVPPDFQNIPGM